MQALVRDLREMLSEQWEYRELLYQMTLRDLLVRYKQSVMGFGWAVFMPLVNTVVFSVIFTRVAHARHGACPTRSSRTRGLLFWNFFASSLRFAVSSLTAMPSSSRRSTFPREIFPFSAILVCLVDLAVGASMLVGLMVWYQVPVGPALLFVPVLLLIQIVFTAGIALLIAMANLFLRDVKYLFEMVLTVWMFATSVVYPVELVGGKLGDGAAAQSDDADHRRLPGDDSARRAAGARSACAGGGARASSRSLVGWLVFHRAEYQFAENV